MQEWWNSPTAAWGFLVIGIGGGGVLAYLLPQVGIPVCILLVLIGIFIVLRAYRHRDKSKKTVGVETEIVDKSESLTDTLTAMHRRLVELQKHKAEHTKISYSQWEKVIPTLADRIGTVKIRDWPKFNRKVKRRIQQVAPKRPNFQRRFRFQQWAKYKEELHFAALSVASELKSELFQSKEWALEDSLKASEWLDGYYWGVKELRDNDPQWKSLFESISHYLKDDILRTLIEKHIDFSYTYNNISLIVEYSRRYQDSAFSRMLYETLVGSPISPIEVEIALAEVLNEIELRLADMN